MSREVRERILDRLENGDDRQARGVLRRNDGCMCVQGVIGDEYLKDHGMEWQAAPEGLNVHVFPIDRKVGWLPIEVLDWSGFSDREIDLMTDWNDAGIPFDEIAAKIRMRDEERL